MPAIATHPDPSKPQITLDDLDGISIDNGDHDGRSNGLCVMEAVAWFAGEGHGDAPACVSPALRAFLIGLNDSAPRGPRQKLKALIPVVVGTASRGNDRQRAYALADWAIRVVVPLALDAAGYREEAKTLRDLPEVKDEVTARVARDTVGIAAYECVDCAEYAASAACCACVYGTRTVAIEAAAAAADRAADGIKSDAREQMWHTLIDSACDLVRRLAA